MPALALTRGDPLPATLRRGPEQGKLANGCFRGTSQRPGTARMGAMRPTAVIAECPLPGWMAGPSSVWLGSGAVLPGTINGPARRRDSDSRYFGQARRRPGSLTRRVAAVHGGGPSGGHPTARSDSVRAGRWHRRPRSGQRGDYRPLCAAHSQGKAEACRWRPQRGIWYRWREPSLCYLTVWITSKPSNSGWSR
jgi:hypothetical protein